MVNKIKILDKKLSELINAITDNNIEKRKQIIKEIVDNGYYGVEFKKSEKLSNILTEIKENINTIDEKEKIVFIGKLSNFKFSIDKTTKNILIFILLFFIIEGYLFGYVQTDQSALIGGIIIGITAPLIYIYMYFFTDRFKKNTKKDIYTDVIINNKENNISNKEENILINNEIQLEYKNNIKIILKKNIILFIIGIISSFFIYTTNIYIVISFIPIIGLIVFIPGILVFYNGIIILFYIKKIISKNKILDIKTTENQNVTKELIKEYTQKEYKQIKKYVKNILIIGFFSIPFILYILSIY